MHVRVICPPDGLRELNVEAATVTVADVARAAGVGEPTRYLYDINGESGYELSDTVPENAVVIMTQNVKGGI